ncbi:MAG: glycosyltransferase family 39 protein [Nodosilinea sp.]
MAKGWIWVRRGAIAAIAVGLVLRFANLDRKAYWHDEAYTSLRVAGYLGPAVGEAVVDRPDLTAADLQSYQHMPPTPSLVDTWNALSAHPEHPPAYYLLAHGWGRLFGASVGGYRAIAAIFGVIALPLMFWLARQLFPSQPAIAWIATALVATSPVHLIYSQEAREYTLWIVGLLLAHGTLWRALRQKALSAWGLYGLALGLAWYGSLMTGLLGLSHGVFMVLSERRPRAWVGFGLAQGLGLGLFVPWLWTIISRWQRLREVTDWSNAPAPLAFLAKLWGLHYSAVVIDFNVPLDHPLSRLGPALVLGLVAIALVYLWRSYPRSTALFLGCGLLIPPLVLIGNDVIRAAQLSRNTRYFFPSLVLLPLAIAPLINHWLTTPRRPVKALGATLLALLLALGVASGVANNRALTWWNKSVGYANIYIADYLNQTTQPLLVLEASGIALGDALSLSHYLSPDTPLWLLPDQALPSPDRLQAVLATRPRTTLFLLQPSSDLLDTVAPGWQTVPAPDGQAFAPNALVQLVPPQAG